MMHLSLKKQVMIVRENFNFETFDAIKLRRYYIKFKVNYIRHKFTYRKRFEQKSSL